MSDFLIEYFEKLSDNLFDDQNTHNIGSKVNYKGVDAGR